MTTRKALHIGAWWYNALHFPDWKYLFTHPTSSYASHRDNHLGTRVVRRKT